MTDLHRRAQRFSVLAAAVVAIGGFVVLLSWWLGIEVVKQPLPHEANMKANTAVGFMLGGVSLALLNGASSARRLSKLLAFALAALGLLTLTEFVFGWSLGIDQLLIVDGTVGMTSAPGRMAPGTAAAFLALGAGLIAFGVGRDGWAAQGALLAAAAVGTVGSVGYLFGARALYGFGDPLIVQRMSVHTAVLLVLLAIGTLFARPASGGPIAVVMSDTLAGIRTRRLLPFAILMPIALGWLRFEGQLHGVFGPQFGTTLVVFVTVVILSVVIWSNGNTLHAAEMRHRQAEEVERRLNVTLEQRVADQTAELSRSEATSRRAEAKFRALLETAPDAKVVVDQSGHIVIVNSQAEKLFGYDRSELLGRPMTILVPERLPGQHSAHRTWDFTHADARVMGACLEVFGRRKDGTEFPAEVSLGLLEIDDGVLISSAIRDITEHKRLEWRLQEASRLKSEFLANMSHELRTPLNAVIGFADLMHSGKAGALSPTHQEYMGDILSSARHLLTLINDVLDLAKVESGTIEFRPVPTDLSVLVREVRDVLRGLAASKHLTFDVAIDPEVGSLMLDPNRLKQILFNYLSNAIKFTPAGGRVTLSIRAETQDLFRIDVEDTGIGIKEDDLPRLFSEFHQIDAGAAAKHQGTGLGLALTKRLAEAHGGRVEVRSTAGRGSKFSAILPRHLPAAKGSMAHEVSAGYA